MDDCIFCQIVAGKIPCYKIYEDEHYLAFLDIVPITKGHTIVIPKQHYRWVWDSPNIGQYMEVCQKIAKHFQKVTKNDLVIHFIIGNEVPHAHIHLLPSYNPEEINQVIHNLLLSRGKLEEKQAKELVEKLKM